MVGMVNVDSDRTTPETAVCVCVCEPVCVCVCDSHYRVVELLQAGQGEEAVHADSVLDQQLDKVHSVQHQGIQHGLLQGAHLQARHSTTHMHTLSSKWYGLYAVFTGAEPLYCGTRIKRETNCCINRL